jgi:hypothetical protein
MTQVYNHLATFLSAEKPLSKTFFADKKCDPYPMTSTFTSSLVGYNTIEEFHEYLVTLGGYGQCLLKGHLTNAIVNESRRGLTDASAPTDLLVIDYDSNEGFESVEELLSEIDPLLAETDYIFQHSASAGITGPVGIRGHIFFMLTEMTSPAVLKQWMRKVNLTSDKFRKVVRLSRNARALCYALDTTVNQNDKLIYIAPPRLVGIEDPITERFELHKNSQRTYTFGSSVSVEANRTREHALISDLQDAAGLPKIAPKYKLTGDIEILTNPANCAVTGSKNCGTWTRLNLNGGDSFAYWYANDNPTILYNFKGEPAVYLKDIAPDYFEQIQLKSQTANMRPFVFRDLESNCFYNAEYDEQTNRLAMCLRSDRSNLADFMIQRGAPAQRVVPDWKMYFDPADNRSVDFVNKYVNLFKPTEYMLETTKEVKTSFPTITKVLQHICVDDPTYFHFLKWLAHIMQYRTKTQTAWIFSGIEGTGKGTLFHQILKPLFGAHHSQLIGQDQADEQYNGYLRHNIILYLDEGDAESSKAAERMLAKFRTIITEPTIPIREMRANLIQAKTFPT